jgi:hypothetical protein
MMTPAVVGRPPSHLRSRPPRPRVQPGGDRPLPLSGTREDGLELVGLEDLLGGRDDLETRDVSMGLGLPPRPARLHGHSVDVVEEPRRWFSASSSSPALSANNWSIRAVVVSRSGCG